MTTQTHEYQAEVAQLLDLMIHSLYSNRDVFLRELISNASDALDRVRFAGLTDPALLPDGELGIEIRADVEKRELSVSDNGIGMDTDDIVQNLGTIARSGTGEFLKKLKDAKQEGTLSGDLIGQFGVGFYASFMVADRVTVTTRKAGSNSATVWESQGDSGFSVSDGERESTGTTVTLHLKESGSESDLADYTNEWVLRQIVKKFSDFVGYPIRLIVSGGDKPASSDDPINSMKAIWTRSAEEVTEEEYKEFYKHLSHDWNDPLLHLATRIEGTFEARALLFLPSVAPFDLYHREMAHRGIQLYVKRVFIMDECRDLMPEYLRFVKGVVDAEDLSLNVSRELLQQNAQIKVIRNHLVKKVLERLGELAKDDPEKYRGFWEQFGPVLKEGMLSFTEKRERIYDLLLCASTRHESQLTNLADVVSRMADDQECIYYLVGANRDVVRGSPQLEAFVERGIEVLLFSDPVDEVWLSQQPPEYAGKKWQSVGLGEVELGNEEEKRQAEEDRKHDEDAFGGLLSSLRTAVQDEVSQVRLSKRLTSSPACLVREEGDPSPQMVQMLRGAGHDIPVPKPILEINPTHPLLARLREICERDATDPRIAEYAHLLFGQSVLAEGRNLDDPAAFSRRIAKLMTGALA